MADSSVGSPDCESTGASPSGTKPCTIIARCAADHALPQHSASSPPWSARQFQHTGLVDMAIVRSVVMLARTLSLSVTAEGIETPMQEAHLRALGCQRGQGYLFARPQAPEVISTLLATVDRPAGARAA